MQTTKKYEYYMEPAIAFALFTSTIGAFLSAAEMGGLHYAMIAGSAVLTAEFISSRFKKWFLSFNIACVLLLIAALLISPQTILNGAKLICNQIYTVSEKYQSYQYIKFAVTSAQENLETQTGSQTEIQITALLLLISSVMAIFTAVMVKRNSIVMYAALFLMFTCFQIYFGIFPSSIWNILFYASFAVASICGSDKGIFIFRNGLLFVVTILAVVCILLNFIYPGESSKLLSLSEDIRNQFGEKIEIDTNAPPQEVDNIPSQEQNTDTNANFTESDSQDDNTGQYRFNFITNFSGSQLGVIVEQSLLAVLVIIFLALSLFVAYFAFRFVRAAKRRKEFDSSDCALAVNCMFTHLMRILVAYGLNPENNVFSAYANQLEAIVSPKYAEEYLKIVNIWYEAVYSEHEMTTEDKDVMRSFLDKTSVLLLKNVNLFTRIRIKSTMLFF